MGLKKFNEAGNKTVGAMTYKTPNIHFSYLCGRQCCFSNLLINMYLNLQFNL